MTYALLDCSAVIRAGHLRAALAAWEYCEDSVRHVFGGMIGDVTADEILDALDRNREGLALNQIRDVFQRNMPAKKIHAALALLKKADLVSTISVKTEGHPATIWKRKA